MKAGLILTAFGILALAVSPARCAETLKFDEVVLYNAPGWGKLLYVVVVTDQPPAVDELDKIVVKYSPLALQEATKYKFKGTPTGDDRSKLRNNVVFAVKMKGVAPNPGAGDIPITYSMSGFDPEQLKEMIAAGPEKALKLASMHNWSPGEIPRNVK